MPDHAVLEVVLEAAVALARAAAMVIAVTVPGAAAIVVVRAAAVVTRATEAAARIPGQKVGAVAVDAGRELGVIEQVAVGVELREIRQ